MKLSPSDAAFIVLWLLTCFTFLTIVRGKLDDMIRWVRRQFENFIHWLKGRL